MRPRFLLLAGLGIAAGTPGLAQQSLGVFGQWAAFSRPGHCYAIAQPAQAAPPQGWRPFVAIGHWPGRRISGQLHVRLSREKRPSSAVIMRVDGQRFQLRGAGREAWAPDDAADEAIRTALRTGIELVVETRSVRGLLVRDHYQLRGAATAMDAAALACRPRG